MEFVRAALTRALKTMCQTALALIPANVMITQVDWKVVLMTSALAGICSILTSIATGLPEVELVDYYIEEEEEENEQD